MLALFQYTLHCVHCFFPLPCRNFRNGQNIILTFFRWNVPFSIDDKFLDITILKAFADDKFSIAKMTISLCDRVEKTGKRRKCYLPAFSSFLTVFFKAVFFRFVKSRDYVVKSKVYAAKSQLSMT